MLLWNAIDRQANTLNLSQTQYWSPDLTHDDELTSQGCKTDHRALARSISWIRRGLPPSGERYLKALSISQDSNYHTCRCVLCPWHGWVLNQIRHFHYRGNMTIHRDAVVIMQKHPFSIEMHRDNEAFQPKTSHQSTLCHRWQARDWLVCEFILFSSASQDQHWLSDNGGSIIILMSPLKGISSVCSKSPNVPFALPRDCNPRYKYPRLKFDWRKCKHFSARWYWHHPYAPEIFE